MACTRALYFSHMSMVSCFVQSGKEHSEDNMGEATPGHCPVIEMRLVNDVRWPGRVASCSIHSLWTDFNYM